ncbi:MAG: PTS transporter subunit EIIC [Symbiobacteriia bacterium]
MKHFFSRFGAAAMTPISVLPAAALLLAIGFLLKGFWPLGANALNWAGTGLFNYLGLVFGVGIAVGLAGGDGIAGLAATVAYVIMDAIARGMNPQASVSVLIGLIAGLMAGPLYVRFHKTRLPEALAFFGGKRSVPIITAVVAVPVGLIVGAIAPAVQGVLTGAGNWMAGSGVLGVAVYGLVERALIPTGLHHILNGVVLLLQGTFTNAAGEVFHGDVARFFAGDPTAGYFMSGAYLVTLFGLPAAALAMYHEARPEHRAGIKGLMITGALTSMLTGITEPVEFSFLFTAPVLYVVHVFYYGLAYVTTYLLHIRAGFGSASGLVEYVLNLHLSQNGWLILPLSVVFGALYYGTFRLLIRTLNLATPGRGADDDDNPALAIVGGGSD